MTVATTSSESRSRPPQSREINYEIERRFLVNYLPPELNLHAAKANNIMQAYLFASEDVEQRIRAENGVFFQTIKRGNGLKRQENDSRIPEQDFNMMLSLATEGTVEKTRYHLSYKSSIIYLDIYKGKCEGLTVAEVEFASEKRGMYKELAKYYDLIYWRNDYKKELNTIRKLIKKYKMAEGNSLLEVACGTGKHLEYLKMHEAWG